MQFADKVGPDQGADLCSQGIYCLSTYTIVSTISVSGQQKPRSVCAYMQADLGLHCLQILVHVLHISCFFFFFFFNQK